MSTELAQSWENLVGEFAMQTDRRLRLLFLAFSLVVMAMPVIAQQVIATVPVGIAPNISAVNPVTNKIYAPDYCGGDPN